MFKKIKQALYDIKAKRQEVQRRKYYGVRGEWIKFFETKEEHLGGIHLPAFVQADQQMKIIMANKELDFYYNKVKSYRKRQSVA